MSNRWVISWLVIDCWRQSMSNRSPKILWPINYSSMTSITHWCNWLLIDDPSITHRLLYCARKTPFLLSCTIFFLVVILLPVLDVFFLITEVPVDDIETRSANSIYETAGPRHEKLLNARTRPSLWFIFNIVLSERTLYELITWLTNRNEPSRPHEENIKQQSCQNLMANGLSGT